MTTLPLNRETVARIIDPRAFMAWEGREPEPKHHAAVERALAKADAILALNPPTESHLAGKGEL